jgi:N-methylhydantoinase B
MRTAGGGGYGDPLERPVELVWRDVREGYLTTDSARARYGVVITSDGVAAVATATAREALRAQQTFAIVAEWAGPEHEGARRILPMARELADRVGISESDVVELVQPRGAPLRAWARVLDERGDRVYVGPLGLAILRAQPGDRFWLRRLNPWGPPPPDA